MSVSSFIRRLGFGAVVGVIATVAYRSIQGFAIDAAVVRSDCWMWRWLPFHPAWFWPYLSMFLLVGLPWFLLRDERLLRRFAACLLVTAAIGWTVFVAYPTACARPSPEGQPFYYAALLAMDRPDNCLPCLHSAFTVLAAWALIRNGPAFFGRTVGRALLALWLVAICVSIVALRQHTDVDMLVGTALGTAAAWYWDRVSTPDGRPAGVGI